MFNGDDVRGENSAHLSFAPNVVTHRNREPVRAAELGLEPGEAALPLAAAQPADKHELGSRRRNIGAGAERTRCHVAGWHEARRVRQPVPTLVAKGDGRVRVVPDLVNGQGVVAAAATAVCYCRVS